MSSAVVMGMATERSSLEEMLDSLMKREDRPKDMPPALPARPASRGRLPSAKRSVLLNFKIGGNASESLLKEGSASSVEKDVVFKGGMFGRKRMAKVNRLEESPYVDGLDNLAASSSTVLDEKLGCSDTIDYALKKKLRVWCRLSDVKWELGQVQSLSGDDANILLRDGKVFTVSMENILPANPDILDGVDDLIQLSYLNEPSIFHNLKCRYTQDLVYTKAGPVLVAINPFKEVPLYGSHLIAAYRQKTMDSPHVYATAETAFSKMMRDGISQSIIISGESGAGKTETAKFTMQYLAALGGDSGVENAVLQTNPILEAFGNAKTSRNDNSSRFAKLTEIHFNTHGTICGAKIQTFLLEKSRVVQRAKGERSYHVFYQLCAGAPPLLKEKLNLRAADEYEYLKQSGCLRVDGVDDAQRFHMLMEAFDIIHVSKADKETAFAVVATVLWLGNIAFSTIDDENHIEVVLSEGVTNVAKLLGCKVPDLMLALSTRESQTDNGSNVEKLTLSQAIDSRDALAKSIYASLFDWLVERINKSLEVGKSHTVKSISILDIYGFESFQKNGLQQLCINYANERLQQHINRHLFKLEQKEYTQDGIDWAYVDFMDNIERLNLFEKKPLGIFSLLDEESTLPKATDLTLANKLKQQLNGNPCFKGERGGAFKVHHCAGEVLYHTNGFLEKNRDPLHSDSIQLLLSSACQLPQLFACHEFNPTQMPDSYFQHLSCVNSQKQSIGTMFKGQLFNLMQQLENTTPHFIQCIKPNSKQLPGMYENEIMLQQLRCCGLLEVVRISRLGYQTRMMHQQFAERYGFLLFENVESQDPLDVSVAILQHFNIQPEMYQVGYKKLFFRTGQIAALEVVRNRRIKGILCVQKFVRGHQARHNYRQLKKGATTLQSFIRGEGVRYQFQKHVKQTVVRKTFDGRQKDIVILQSEMSNLNHEKANRKPEKKFQQKKDPAKEHPEMQSSEFQRRVLKAEAVLRQKEEENVKLQQQLQQYDTRWSEYEAKIKSKEEMWQKQVTSLQMSLAAANKNLSDASPVRHDYDSESAISTASRTPQTTPPRQPHSSDAGLAKYSGGTHNAVGHLVKEFEQHTQVFEDDARFLVEVKPGQLGSNVNPVEELQKLKFRFAAWKKDYRGRLREAKAALYKLGFSGGDKTRRKWWGKKGSKT